MKLNKKGKICISLDERLKKKLDDTATENDIPRSRVIEDILLQYYLKGKPPFWG